MPQQSIKIEVQTKRIGKYRLKKIVSIVYEKRDYYFPGIFEWRVSIKGRENGARNPMGYGDTKKQAKDVFVEDFENNLHLIKDLIK